MGDRALPEASQLSDRARWSVSRDRLERLFQSNDDDPWGHNFRAVEQCRHDRIIRMAAEYALRNPNGSSGTKILDVGCATGDLTSRLYELASNVIGIDCSETAIKRAKDKFKHIEFRVGALPDADLEKESFGLITCCECLYYIDTAAQTEFLSELRRLLTKDGCAIVTSLVGPKPYFTSDDLVATLCESFAVDRVEYYGSRLFAKCEQTCFRCYRNITRVQRFLRMDREELQRELANVNTESGRAVLVGSLFISRWPACGRLMEVLLSALNQIIRCGLEVRVPARAVDFISRKLSLKGSHTLVLVSAKQ